ncbi:IS6 family transposase, partial [Priestia megaterium]
TAKAIISGIEVMHMMKKKQVYQEVKSVQNQISFIHQLFVIAA